MERRCKYCNKIILPNKNGKVRKGKIFCNQNCNSNYHARLNYIKNKNDPHYRAVRRKAFNNWIKRNPKKFKTLVNQANLKRSRRVVAERREKGVCIYCGGKKERADRVGCLKCREKKWNKDITRRYKKREDEIIKPELLELPKLPKLSKWKEMKGGEIQDERNINTGQTS